MVERQPSKLNVAGSNPVSRSYKNIVMKKSLNFFYLALAIFFISIGFKSLSNDDEWEYIFNGNNLDDWTVKIKGYPSGENFGNTFKVKDGEIQVSYENYENFDFRYGHLYYTKKKFKNYHLKLEYKFFGEQANGGEGWATKNSGVMFHSQHPETMLIDQPFPVSIETQFLGGLGTGDRPTGNLCTPGTDVDMNFEKVKKHCTRSNSDTYHNDDWVEAEIIVYSDSIAHHLINGKTVLTYTNLRYGDDGRLPENMIHKKDQKLSEGYISLQSESHPIKFKNIKIKSLD